MPNTKGADGRHPSAVYDLKMPHGYTLSPGDAFTVYSFLLGRTPAFDPVCLYTLKGNYVIAGTNVTNNADLMRTGLLINGKTGAVWEAEPDGQTNWHGVGFTTMSFDSIKSSFPVGSDIRTAFNALGMTRSQFVEPKSSYPFFSHNLLYVTFDLSPGTWTIRKVTQSQWRFR